MQKDSIEEQKIQQAKNNILRGEDIDSAAYILEKYMFDGMFFIGGRVNPVKVATRQVLNFIKRYQKSDYETICLENNEMKEILDKIQLEYNNLLKENEELKDTNCLVKRYFKLKDTNTYLQKENDELKKQRNIEPILINNKMYFIDNEIYNELLEDIKSNYTSVQKVKDKIEKLNDESHAEELEDIMNRKNYTITELVQYVLQELIEGRK